LKTFRQKLKEDVRQDSKYRRAATAIAIDVMKHIAANGFSKIALNSISSAPESKYIQISPLQNSGKYGDIFLAYNSGKVSITIGLDKDLLKDTKLFLRTLIHELIHAYDILRVPKEYLRNLAQKAKRSGGTVDLESYANDPLEMNAYFNEVIFSIEYSKKSFPNLKTFIETAWRKLPDFFSENLYSNNKQKLLKRFGMYYQNVLANK
jgi:hypothetical protein